MTPYHWLVVIIASAGWLFDCMDQRLFILARESALKELLGESGASAVVKQYSGYATTAMILGWATGGIIFGMMSDRWGRVKTMVATLVVYSGFTGLSGFSQSWIDFTIYRFLVGLGVGGMFGAATTLVAESVPGNVRAVALGGLQALSAMGNIVGLAHQPEDSAGGDGPLVGILRLEAPLLRRHSAFAAGGADHFHTQGTRAVAARERSREVRCDPARRFAARDVQVPTLAAQQHCRPDARRVWHVRLVGDWILLAGVDLHGAGRFVTTDDRHRTGRPARRSRTSERFWAW